MYVYADTPVEWNCSEWRALGPSDTLNRLGKHRAKLVHVQGFLNYLDSAMQDIVAPCDIIIFQRNLVTAHAFDAMEYWQGMGKPVAVDLDDAYPILPWSNPAHAFWIQNVHKMEPDPIAMLEEGLRRSDGLIAPNRLLLADWKHATRGYYLPNFARGEWWKAIPNRADAKKARDLPNDRIIIGWGGSVSHYDSWWGSGIRQAAENVSRRHPEVLWMICGNDKRIYDQLPVSWGQKVWQPGVQPDQWPSVVACFDIGVAPLYGPYDQRRSWIKGLEYILAGVPWIGSTGEPYSDLANMGRLVEPVANDWEAALETYVTNIKQLQESSQQLAKVGQQWFIENQQQMYEVTYETIIKNKASLGRLPGLMHVGFSDDRDVIVRGKK